MGGQVILCGQSENGSILPATVDDLSGSLIAMGPEHLMTHDGKHFVLSHHFASVANAAKANVLIITKAGYWLHATFFVFSSLGLTFAIYEDTDYGYVLANKVTPISRNRTNTTEENGIEGACHTPSGSGEGTAISPVIPVGTGGANPNAVSPGLNRDQNEYILKPSTKYLLQVVSKADSNLVTIGLDFYIRSVNS